MRVETLVALQLQPPPGPANAAMAGKLAGHDLPGRDREDPLDLGSRRWVALGSTAVPQPPPHGAAGQRGVDIGQGSGVGRVDGGRQLVEEGGLIGEQLRLPRQDRDGIAATQIGQLRQQLIANSIPEESRVLVGRILDWGQSHVLAQSPRLGPPEP